ncbi:MAG TPA: alanine racemase [Acidobacteriaceae bacterium]|nr:alanine racemase [Acidobacteriaceae bacterium]
MLHRPLWAEVSSRLLLANYKKLRQLAGSDMDLMAVVKANAYGHGALTCAPLLAGAGAQWLGVTSAEEGAAIRAVCPDARIVLMAGVFPGEADMVIDHDLTPVVWESWQLDLLEEAADARGMQPLCFAAHLEIDTGMSRQGVRVVGKEVSAEAAAVMARFHALSPLRLEGVMTHFSEPENISTVRPNPQLANLRFAVDWMLDHGMQPKWLHAGNSSSLVAGPDRRALMEMATRLGSRLMLRPGLALYGYLDRITEDGLSWKCELEFDPVLAWKTEVTSLRTLSKGETAGYGNTFEARKNTRLALLPVGYADGLNRLLSNRGHVLIRGRQAPIAGRISMDQTVVDVTEIPSVAIGDEVVLLGSQGRRSISAWDIADLTGSIPWEVLCAISARVPRKLVA